MKLENQVALITGSGRGIGRAIAERFAAEGADVFLTARTEAQLKETAAAIEKAGNASGGSGGRAAYLPADAGQADAAEKIVAAARKEFGRIDILVNNAGVLGPVKPLADFTDEEWDGVMAVNLRSAFQLTRAVLPEMAERKRGAILNISTVAAKVGFPLTVTYAVSKAGMLALTRTTAAEGGPAGVRANALCPGPVEGGDMWLELGDALESISGLPSEKFRQQNYETLHLKRPVSTEEVAAAALFLCSDESGGITGQAINIDSGMVFY